MEIGEDVTEALRAFSSNANGTDANLKALAAAAISVVSGDQTEESALSGAPFEAMDVDFIKCSYSALVCLYLEASRRDASSKQLASYLRTVGGFSDSASAILCDLFEENKQKLRRIMSGTANHNYLRRVIGVDWRLDYCVSSSEDRNVKDLLYFLGLRTLDATSGSSGNIEFVCSVEQLQDLVGRLKEACKSVERTADRAGLI